MMATRGVNKSPFAEWIIEEPKPKDFGVPSFKQFDGKTDPVDHIFNFQQKMALETRNEAILCKVFSTNTSRTSPGMVQVVAKQVYEQFWRFMYSVHKIVQQQQTATENDGRSTSFGPEGR